ncbi:MAG: biotin/lipoyl-containing protein, partial [Gammaproteobacteria bacterium]
MAEPYAIKMPQLSDTMTEGVLVSWEKNIGDAVARGDIVATVETDKAVMDVEIFRDGFLSGPLAAIDSTVPVTGAIGYIVESKDDVVEGESEAPAAPAAPVPASPAAATARPAAATTSPIPGSATA